MGSWVIESLTIPFTTVVCCAITETGSPTHNKQRANTTYIFFAIKVSNTVQGNRYHHSILSNIRVTKVQKNCRSPGFYLQQFTGLTMFNNARDFIPSLKPNKCIIFGSLFIFVNS